MTVEDLRISICIPQHNRVRFLLGVLDSIRVQDWPHLEVCISDDCSTDDTEIVLAKVISEHSLSPLRIRYSRNSANLGYDGNLRAALAMGTGDYLFVLGNDDALADAGAMGRLAEFLQHERNPEVVFVNHHAYGDPGHPQRRATVSGVLGQGPEAGLKYFRRFSFVGGLAFKREWFERFNTNAYDGSVYFQIYLATRIASAGGRIASLDDSLVAKDIQIDGRVANSYADTLAENNARLQPRTGGLDQVARVVWGGLSPGTAKTQENSVKFQILRQILLNSYPYWLFDYRRRGVWRAAANLALGCRPPSLGRWVEVSAPVAARLWVIYVVVTLAGLLLPIALLDYLRSRLTTRRLTLPA
jgi:glycosyltransferase involved in cell wall biosynthesis